MPRKSAILVLALSALSLSAAAETPTIETDELRIGSHVELVTKETVSGFQRSSTNYLGTVKELSDDAVILRDVTLTNHSDKTPPVVRNIPYVNRFFKNVGIGRTHLGDKSVVVPRKDIARIEPILDEVFLERSEPRPTIRRQR